MCRKLELLGAIRETIINGVLQPGQLLSERALAQQYMISRTPIREILRELEQEGLVELYPGRGTFVRKLTITDVRDIFQVRQALECSAARIAASIVSIEEVKNLIEQIHRQPQNLKPLSVHDFIFKATRNSLLLNMYTQLRSQLLLVRSISKGVESLHRSTSQEKHMPILDALINQDAIEAEKAMRQHLTEVHKSVLQFF